MIPIAPSQIPKLFQQALALQRKGRFAEAEAGYKRLLLARPKLAEAHFQLGNIAAARANWPTAVTWFEKARESKPKEPAILVALAQAQDRAGQPEAALLSYAAYLKIKPKDRSAQIERARLLQTEGRFEEAEAAFRALIKATPDDGELYRIFLATKKLQADDPLVAQMERLAASGTQKGRAAIHLGFALAKVMEDTKQYDRVFTYLGPACAAQRKAFPPDLDARDAEVDGLIAAFQDVEFPEPNQPDAGELPIFVTGLPRSGTTLVEQILSSHPMVIGGGELPIALRETYRVIGTPEKGFRPGADLTQGDYDKIGSAYTKAIRSRVEFDQVVTDKAIQPHLILGVLRRALPQARFVAMDRDPRDNLLSILKNLFADGTHAYSYDQLDLVRYWRSFRRILAFWEAKLPRQIHRVSYDALVADPEAETRALIKAVGLPWDDACLRFFENKRAVSTLSIHQVRQPIYKGSSGAWKRYEAELRPMLEALEAEECH